MAVPASPPVGTRLGALELTAEAARRETSEFGAWSFGSIMLDQISFCGVEGRSQPLLLVLAAILAIAGYLRIGQEQIRELSTYLFVAAGVLVILYVVTRETLITVASSGGRISTTARGLKRDVIREFVDAVERARPSRAQPVGAVPTGGGLASTLKCNTEPQPS